MSVRLARAQAADPESPLDDSQPARWTCAFVNNMPDAAFDATERQFLDLLDAGSGGEVVEVDRYAVPGVPRGEQTAARIAGQYLPFDSIWSTSPDLLVVTGSNPLASRIEDEPYWDDLAKLLSWGRDNVQSMLLSCMSAHAGLHVFDGLERSTLPAKCTGVFAQRASTHPLAVGLDPNVVLPHSRLNTVELDRVEAAGYQVALDSEGVGWSVIARGGVREGGSGRDREGCQIILVQGHPEYDPSSLLREYHRDARRYALGERDDVPCLPLHCVAPGDWEQLCGLHERIAGGERDPAIVESFPFEEMGARAGWPWRNAAVRLYSNWMAGVNKPE